MFGEKIVGMGEIWSWLKREICAKPTSVIRCERLSETMFGVGDITKWNRGNPRDEPMELGFRFGLPTGLFGGCRQ